MTRRAALALVAAWVGQIRPTAAQLKAGGKLAEVGAARHIALDLTHLDAVVVRRGEGSLTIPGEDLWKALAEL